MENSYGLRERKGKERMVFDVEGIDEVDGLSNSKSSRSLWRRLRSRRALLLGLGAISLMLFLLYRRVFSDTTPLPLELDPVEEIRILEPAISVTHVIQPARQTVSAMEASPSVMNSPPQKEKLGAIVGAFLHAWNAYERDAFGADDYYPISHSGRNHTQDHGYGYTIVDTLDTMLIMKLDAEHQRARTWVEKSLDFDIDGTYNLFETTIRVLGGLLSAFSLSKDDLYLEKAKDLAERLSVAFSTNSGLPATMVNLKKRSSILDYGNQNRVSIAEVATLQLEFRYLAHVTGNQTYWDIVEKVMKVIEKAEPYKGLAPIFMDPHTGQFVQSDIRLGSRVKYVIWNTLQRKQYLQTGRTEPKLRAMYDETMDAVYKELIMYTPRKSLMHTGELMPKYGENNAYRLSPKQDHLVCFLGGSLMLGAINGSMETIPPDISKFSETAQRDWKIGQKLIETCMETHRTATGLSPEIVYFWTKEDMPADLPDSEHDWYIKGGSRTSTHAGWDARYSLRPETVESLFIAYRLTHDERYREWGWQIFQAIETHCKLTDGGYASVLNVDSIPVAWDDKMETFFLSETLKYLYLLFDDPSNLPLDEYVFNTEAHPLPVFNPGFSTQFS